MLKHCVQLNIASTADFHLTFKKIGTQVNTSRKTFLRFSLHKKKVRNKTLAALSFSLSLGDFKLWGTCPREVCFYGGFSPPAENTSQC